MFSIHGAATRRRGGMFAIALAVMCASEAFASIIPQQGARGRSQDVRARCSGCVVKRDTVRERQERLLMRIDSLKHEFEHDRLSDIQRERVTRDLRLAIHELTESIEQMQRANALAMAQQGVEEAEAAFRALPEVAVGIAGAYRGTGYMGVVFAGTSREFIRDNERFVQFYRYPRIELVEPSSPAEKAGIQQGDTVLSFNGSDLREREISLTRLLVPNSKVIVRVRRDGSAKDLKVIIGEPPSYVVGRVGRSPTPRANVRALQSWPEPARVPVTVEPQVAPTAPSVFFYQQEGVGGARVVTINEGLGRTIGVSSGVLVIGASPGTPAYESGLRDGDIVVRAAGHAIRTVNELRGVIARNGDESGVKLLVLRDRKAREVTLRW